MRTIRTVKLKCGHEIEEGSRWCHTCNHLVAKIKYGEAGVCPYCNKTYPVDKYKFCILPSVGQRGVS